MFLKVEFNQRFFQNIVKLSLKVECTPKNRKSLLCQITCAQIYIKKGVEVVEVFETLKIGFCRVTERNCCCVNYAVLSCLFDGSGGSFVTVSFCYFRLDVLLYVRLGP